MLSLMIEDGSIIGDMCENIKQNRTLGIYDGAYNCVRLAVKEMD